MGSFSQIDIQNKLSQLELHDLPFVGGEFVCPNDAEYLDCINPSDENVITRVPLGTVVLTNQAVEVAKRAHAEWRLVEAKERKRIILRLADLLTSDMLNMALLESLETGKPIGNCLAGDLPSSIDSLRWYAEAADKIHSKIFPSPSHVVASAHREPMGVVAAIVPWNFPLYLACIKIAPALAAGNTVILKPAEQTPLTALRLAKLGIDAGLPPGVLNVVPGRGQVVGRTLAKHRDVNMVSFTGSTATGKLIMQAAAETNLKRVLLECGGKCPNIVLPDYNNIEKVVSDAVDGAFFNQGEVCCSPSLLMVHHGRKDEILDLIYTKLPSYYPSDPLDLNTKMGALISQEHLNIVSGYVQQGLHEGAQLVHGGKSVKINGRGFYFEPTIFNNVNMSMTIAREEIFGPVLSIVTYDSVDQIPKMVNQSQYGLSASIWSVDHALVRKISNQLQVGFVSVNAVSSGDVASPFGGYKESGIGTERGLSAFDNYSQPKTIWVEYEKEMRHSS